MVESRYADMAIQVLSYLSKFGKSNADNVCIDKKNLKTSFNLYFFFFVEFIMA